MSKVKANKETPLVYARMYLAYFFDKPIIFPVRVIVLARDFESALRMLRERFPNRRISALHSEGMDHAAPPSNALLIESALPEEEFDIPRGMNGIPEEAQKYFFRDYKAIPVFNKAPVDERS